MVLFVVRQAVPLTGNFGHLHKTHMPKPQRTGFTLIELLVVVAITAVLMAMLLPGISASREAARKSQCAHKLTELGMALHAYHQTFMAFPAGSINAHGPVGLQPSGYHHNWLVALLPYLDEQNVANQIDLTRSIHDPVQLPARQHLLPGLVCPSDPVLATSVADSGSVGLTSYAGVHHDRTASIDINNTGLLFLNQQLSLDDISDGAAYVLMVGEIKRDRKDLGWASGTAATLRNTGTLLNATSGGQPPQATERPTVKEDAVSEGVDEFATGQFGMGTEAMNPEEGAINPIAMQPPMPRPPNPKQVDITGLAPGGFGGHHAGVCQFLFADGHVQAISQQIDPTVLRRLANRDDKIIVAP